VLSAVLARNRASWNFLTSKRYLLAIATAILFCGVAAFTLNSDPLGGGMISFRYSVLALFYTSCLLLALTRERGAWQTVLTLPALTSLGTIAYFTYLFHIPMIEVARRVVNHFSAHPTDVSTVLVAYLLGVALTFGLAAVSWRYFEKPLVRQGRTFTY